jgi:RHS repeat-associated protein
MKKNLAKLFLMVGIALGFLGINAVPSDAQSWSNGYAFRRAITIDHTKVSNTDQTNFPVLISGTYSYLATVSNGGNVTNANGYDIIFTSDAAGTAILPFEQESYSSATGAMSYWIRVSSLSHTTDTAIYMFYGNGSVTTDQSNKTGVWDSNFVGVWHLPNGSTLTANDSTSNGFNGTINNATATSGQIGGAANFGGSTNISVATTGTLSGAFTAELWAKPTSAAGGVFGSRSPADSSFDIQISSTGLHGDIGNGSSWITTAANANFSYAANTWHHFVYVVTTSGYKIYGDGSQIGSGSFSATPLLYDSNHRLTIGGIGYPGYNFSGAVDEVRVSNVARTADWIATERTNQSSPAGFYSVGTVAVNGLAGSTAPYLFGSWPASGPITTPVTILGANFGATQGSSTLTFNGTAATSTQWSDTSIVAPVPSAASTGNVVVTVSGVSSNPGNFTVTTGPGITGISPTFAGIGAQVVISGVNFGSSQGTSTVKLNGVSCTVISWSASSISVVVPVGASSGPFSVTVGGQSATSAPFTVSPVPPGWLYQDVGAVGVAGNATYSSVNGRFTVQASGTDIWGTADSFHFMYQPLNGDGTIVARVVSLQGGGSNPKAGVMVRETLSAGSTDAYMAFQPGQLVFDYRSATGGSAANQGTVNGNLPYWVKLVRSGNSFSGYTSPDGVSWTQVGTAQTVTMAQNVYVGLMVTSQNNSALATGIFDDVSVTTTAVPAPVISSVSSSSGYVGDQLVIAGLNFGVSQGGSVVLLNGLAMTINSWNSTSITFTIPPGASTGYLVVAVAPSMNDSNPVFFTVDPPPQGFLSQDIGSGLTGSANFLNGTFDTFGSGVIATTADGFHFVYQTLSGDGSIVARVAYVNGASFPQAGVMIRETLTTNSATAFLFYQPNQAFMDSRLSAGAGMTQQSVGLVSAAYPYWLKLTRSGNTFSGYTSLDGVYWAQIGSSQTITMAQNVYIGVATASASSAALLEAKYDNLSIGSTASPAPAITNISATTGATGSQVTISGTGFGASQGSSAVYLNDSPATINSWSASTVTITIPSGATTGYLTVAVAPSMNNTNPVWFTVTSQPLPAGWLDRDVGVPGSITSKGVASYSNGAFAVQGSGTGVYTASDSMHFIYQPLSGDGTIFARVSNLQGGEAGVLIRETLDPGSTSAYVRYNPNQAYFNSRATAGTAALQQGTFFSSSAYPYWAKVTRSGNVFTGYFSPDGIYWTQVGTSQTINMAQNVFVGMAYAIDGTSVVGSASFDSPSFTAGTPVGTPSVTSASPTVAGPGYSVTVVGSGFGATQGTSQVYFNGAAASAITSWSNTQVVATVPNTASSGPVTVVVNGIGSNRTVSITVFKPVITNLTPSAASPGGTITISGSGFTANQSTGFFVAFNGVSTSSPSWSDTSITAKVPSSATSGPVTVVEAGVSSNGVQFTVLEPLAVSGISPTSGPTGTAVTISGAGFGPTQSNSTVDFYGTAATVTNWTDTQITATVPSGAPTGSVNVSVAGNKVYGPSFTVNSTLTLTDSLGNSTSYTSALIGGIWVPTNSQGSGCSSCSLRGTIQSTYDGAGNVLTRTDELGRTTTYTYDPSNNVTSVSVPIGNGTNATTSYTYNSFGEVLTTTDPLGKVTTNAYDTNGNLLTVTTPAPGTGAPASVTHFAYDTKGELTSITDPLNNITAIAYTAAGLIQTITDAHNNVTTYAYDSHGNRTSVTDALNHQTTFAYDAGDRLTTITYPGGTTTTFGYDYRGRRTSVTDQNGKTTTYAYDDADRLFTVTDAANNVTTYGYDTENNLTSIKDANNHTTTFAYDAFGRVTQTTFPSGAVETYSYDAVGNLLGKTDRKNQSITYTYDQLNRLAQKTYPDSSTVNYTYDNDSRLTQVTDPTGTYSFTFDNMGRLTTTTTQYAFLMGRTFTTAYSYDAASNRIGFTDPEGGATAYAYDTLNRLQTLTAPAAISGGSFGFGYDALSRRTSLTRPNAVNTTYGYDNLSRLLSVTHAKGGTTLDGATYTVDNAGNRTAKSDLQAGVTTNYGYDAIYQLLNATQGSTTESYSYDPVGNRLSSLGVASYSYNPSNELTSTSSTTYGYDNNGSPVTKNDSTGITTYGWDFENRLTSVTLPGNGGTVSFKYDPFGRRIYKASSSGTTVYVYDLQNLIEETNSSGAVVARYTQGVKIDEPLAMLRSGATNYYEADGLESVTSLSNAAGALAQTYTFDSFGNQTASSGSLTNPFRFTAREFDAETGLQFSRARYYDPNAGRFISEDPTGFSAGNNFYQYVLNDPLNSIDPLGLDTTVIIVYDKIGGITVGTHAAVLIDNDGRGNPILYDPAGDYRAKNHCGEGDACGGFQEEYPGLGGNPDADLGRYKKFQEKKGSTVKVFVFPTTPQEEKQIADRIDKIGGAAPFFCAASVSNALKGIGPFKNLKGSMSPGNLADQLNNILNPPKPSGGKK